MDTLVFQPKQWLAQQIGGHADWCRHVCELFPGQTTTRDPEKLDSLNSHIQSLPESHPLFATISNILHSNHSSLNDWKQELDLEFAFFSYLSEEQAQHLIQRLIDITGEYLQTAQQLQ